MADIRLAKPAPNTAQNIPSTPEGHFIFDFSTGEATLSRDGDDLLLSFEDGATIRLEDFYTTYSKDNMPSFEVDGAEIAGEDFFMAMNEPDLMPAAGPAARAAGQGNGNRFHDYVNASLLDGLDRLGGLDVGWPGSDVNPEVIGAATSTADIDYPVIITPGNPGDLDDIPVLDNPDNPHDGGAGASAERDVLRVQESGLRGAQGASANASGYMTIEALDGVASIVIGGVVVYDGTLTGAIVPTDEGYLEVTGFNADTGRLDYTYHLTQPTQEHGGEGNDQIAHDLVVTVTDTDGSTGTGVVTVVITDDVPSIESFKHGVTEGDSNAITGNALEGAVAGADTDATFAWNANQSSQYGEITLNGDGTYSYTLDNDNEAVKALTDGQTLTEEFTYTYTDADGDVAEGKVTITINGVDNGVVVTPSDPSAESEVVTVYESGLADGSSPDGKPTTAEGSLSISAPDGVASIVIDGVTVFENGALTSNTISTDEGVLTVTGFDAATGELKFTYELTGNTTEHNTDATDMQVSHDLAVTVTDVDGTEAGSTITVTIVDDGPSINVTGLEGAVDSGTTSAEGSWTHDFGADLPTLEKITVNGQELTLADGGSVEVAGTYGTLKVNADGTYTYTANPNASGSDSFKFSITDADGDSKDATLTVTVEDSTVKPDAMTFVTQDSDVADNGSDSMTVKLAAGVTLTQEAVNAVNATIEYGQFSLSEDGRSLIFTQNSAYTHGEGEDSHTFGQVSFDVTDANGNATKLDVTVTIVDDEPSISVSDIFTSVVPGDSGDNLADGTKFSFTTGDRTQDQKWAGREIAQGTELAGWDGVKIYAGKVTYIRDADGNTVIAENGLNINAGYTLQYSTYPNYTEKPASDWGLMVSSMGDAQEWEINASKDGRTSEAVVFDLGGKLAYGVTIDFGAFYLGGEAAQYDHVSEKALVTFYRDGQIVGSTLVEGQSSDGKFTLNSSDVVLGGFDKVVISAVDNRTTAWPEELSDFTIQGIDFITKRDAPIIVSEGTVTAESGADGFADVYADSHVRFDLAGMVKEGTLSGDGTFGIITVLVDDKEQDVTLTLSEGNSGDSILEGTLADGEQLFTATLDNKDGSWTMEQYEQFRVAGEKGQSSNQFELVFKTEDADGDVVGATVNVPLEVVEQTPGTDASIDNGNDTIVIHGGENLAFFISDGEPTYSNDHGSGNSTPSDVVEDTLHAAQDLQNAGGGVHVNAIGIGESVSEGGQKILDLIDNTGGSEAEQTEYPHEGWVTVDSWLGSHREWQWTTSEWSGEQSLILGDSDLVNSENDLTAALVGGSEITSTDLADTGNDEITAADSASSVIVYGDVQNTDRLLYELNQNDHIQVALVAAGIGYGSGTEVFQWLEENADSVILKGTEYEGWTHTDTVDYMLEHAEELGYETRVDGTGDFYLVNAHGDVWNMDGSEAGGVELAGLTGREDGNDTITGSSADDVIFGQEGNDTIHGGAGDDVIYGGSGNDTIHGDAGNDYIDGGAGADTIYGGEGNDIIVYDANDVLVNGGEGIDFMVSTDSDLTLDALLAGGEGKPNVDGIEVLIKGSDALSLTSVEQLAADYGISINVDAGGHETLTLDMTKWTEQSDGTYDFNGGADLTLQLDAGTDAALQDVTSADNAAAQQQVFLLQNSNG